MNNFPEFDPYQPENVPLYDVLYGKNLISLGGFAAIDNMFVDLNIKGLKALDVGCGLGGVAFYLAEKYGMDIAGIEIRSWMMQYAKKHTPNSIAHAVEFDIYNAQGELPYESETFDLVYSKGVLNHVSNKNSLFRQVNKVLKAGGLFVIADWIFPLAAIDNLAHLVCETEESYKKVLTETGFNEIQFQDDSDLFILYANELLTRLANNKEFIKKKYNAELFSILQMQHEELIEKMTHYQKFATRILAKKAF